MSSAKGRCAPDPTSSPLLSPTAPRYQAILIGDDNDTVNVNVKCRMRDVGCGRVRRSWTTSRVPREDDDSEAGPFLHEPFHSVRPSVLSEALLRSQSSSVIRPDSHSCPEPRLSFSPDFSSHSHSESTTSRRLGLHHDGCRLGLSLLPSHRTRIPNLASHIQTVYAPVPSHAVRSGQSRGTVEISRAERMGLTQRKRMAGRTSMSVIIQGNLLPPLRPLPPI